jgi:hypothetical protein
MRESGEKTSKKASECRDLPKEMPMRVNGFSIRCMAKEFWCMLMVQSMKVCGSMDRRKRAMVSSNTQMEM